jgi:hypothetical protein
MAIVFQKFSRRSLPAAQPEPSDCRVMIRLIGLQPTYMPGDSLEFEYRVANVDRGSIVAVECSVCWITEGKGTEDLGVHFFQRLAGDSLAAIDWSIAQKISCPLPVSPLSYEGQLLKISWCVRARFFLNDGTELMAQQPFYLGTVTREI